MVGSGSGRGAQTEERALAALHRHEGVQGATLLLLTHLCPPFRSTFAVRETASLGIMGAPRLLPEHYRL